jgi:soluble lytic murein transglycosylase-like protein
MSYIDRRWVAIAASLALAGPAHAFAQVLEVGAEGAVTTYSGPSLYTDDGVRDLRAARAPAQAFLSRPAPSAVEQAIAAASIRHAVSAPLLREVAWQESHYNQNAVSPKGARGVMQLMPTTAQSLGVDAHDLQANIDGGAAYLAQLMRRFDGDLVRALAAYNAGPENVERYGGVPPFAETQAYVRSILARLTPQGSASTGVN